MAGRWGYTYITEGLGLGQYHQDRRATRGHKESEGFPTTFMVYISRRPNIETDVPVRKPIPWHMDVLLTFPTCAPD